VQLQQLFTEIENLLSIDLEEKEITLSYPNFSQSIWADREMVRQLFFNLLLNSIQAIEQQGQIFIEMDTFKNTAYFCIKDNGQGVHESDQEKLFAPYFTTKEDGSGLGLSICRQIALAHQWNIGYKPSEQGACFFLEKVKLL
jgi:signal transduction histidine kinase